MSSEKKSELSVVRWPDAKSALYADQRVLVGSASAIFKSYKDAHFPYGLVDRRGATVKNVRTWLNLESVLSATMRDVFNKVEPENPEYTCPYRDALNHLNRMQAHPKQAHSDDFEVLRAVTMPGAVLASALVSNLLRKIPAILEVHEDESDPAIVAGASWNSLLDVPMRHPQQRAAAFMFTLAPAIQGSPIMDRDKFMSTKVIEKYTAVRNNSEGVSTIEWVMPTGSFTLLSEVAVANRNEGHEADMSGDHFTRYPAGTKLEDIAITEPTLGCPGKVLARELWTAAVDVVVSERLWQR